MIQVKNLSKVYQNGFHAVKGVSFNVEPGELFGIIGLSGAGKSSLIKMLNRLEEPSSGEIFVDNIDITKISDKELLEKRQKIGMIFQHFNLLTSRNVFGNISFALEIAGWKKNDIDERVKELLELVELSDKAESFPSQLSGGQKQRVAIARALANHPSILLSDEATSALDPKTTKSILALIKNIQKKLNLTVVIITHQMEVIRDVCNKVAVMSDGKIIETGFVHNVFSKPQHKITKELIDHLSPEESLEVELVKTKSQKIIKLNFVGEATDEPVISRVIRKMEIDINILGGSVDVLTTLKVGHLLIELIGDMSKQENAIKEFENYGLVVEVIYDGKC
ncbi:MAG: methionine ABC transporter ATP-binding protein [Fusobacteriaceae bacterium]